MDELIKNVHLRLQTFMFFLVFLLRLINQKSIEMKRNRDRRMIRENENYTEGEKVTSV
jgi:hypothetical protein